MYKQKNNFEKYTIEASKDKKLEAKRILNSILETSSLDMLDSLYQPTQPADKKSVQQAKFTQPSNISNLEPVSDTLLTVGKLPLEQDTVVIGVKKPIQVIFKDDSNTTGTPESTEATPIKEDLDSIVDDDILAPIENAPETESEYDYLNSAPPLDLSSDLENAVLARGQGMMTKVKLDSNMSKDLPAKENIKSIEDDPEGLSVVGIDSDIGTKLLF